MGSMKYQNYFEELQDNPLLLNSIEKGTMPILHITNHNFRDRIKSAELGAKGNIYVQKFLPAKQRAELAQKQIQDAHLKEDVFNPNQPHKNHAYWLKVRKFTAEGPSMRFGANLRTENERINEKLKSGDNKWIDHTKKDTKMTFYPNWKPVVKNNWLTPKNFDLSTVLQQQAKSDPPWEQFPIRVNHVDSQYIDSLEKVGEQIHRFRDKEKEISKSEFIGVIAQDPTGRAQHISQSLRTYMSQKALKVDPHYDEYSKNNFLGGYYKQPLVSTKSVDHTVPYPHSQNIRSSPMKDLMPKADKVYKLSIKEFCNANKTQEMMNNNSKISSPTSEDSKQENIKVPVKSTIPTKSSGSAPYIWEAPQQKVSRGTTPTTSQTWKPKSRAQTAKERSKNPVNDLQQRMQNDPYYLPSNNEAKELVEKYFHK